MSDNKIFDNNDFSLNLSTKNSLNINSSNTSINNESNSINSIIEILTVGIIRLELKKLNNSSNFNNSSDLNNNLESNQNECIFDYEHDYNSNSGSKIKNNLNYCSKNDL